MTVLLAIGMTLRVLCLATFGYTAGLLGLRQTVVPRLDRARQAFAVWMPFGVVATLIYVLRASEFRSLPPSLALAAPAIVGILSFLIARMTVTGPADRGITTRPHHDERLVDMRYRHERFGYSLEVPEGWRQTRGPPVSGASLVSFTTTSPIREGGFGTLNIGVNTWGFHQNRDRRERQARLYMMADAFLSLHWRSRTEVLKQLLHDEPNTVWLERHAMHRDGSVRSVVGLIEAVRRGKTGGELHDAAYVISYNCAPGAEAQVHSMGVLLPVLSSQAAFLALAGADFASCRIGSPPRVSITIPRTRRLTRRCTRRAREASGIARDHYRDRSASRLDRPQVSFALGRSGSRQPNTSDDHDR